MFIRALFALFVLSLLVGAFSLATSSAQAAEPLLRSSRDANPPKIVSRIPDDLAIYRRPSALEVDVEGNPVYTQAAKAVLVDQILSDFAEFDQSGLRRDGVLKPGAGNLSPFIVPPLRLMRVSVEDPYTLSNATGVCPTTGVCELPLDYNVSTPRVQMVWSFRDAAIKNQFMNYINGTSSRRLDVSINGETLIRKPNSGPGPKNFEYEAYYGTGKSCGSLISLGCLVVIVQRGAWFDGPAPWPQWDVKIEGSRTLHTRFGFPQTTVEQSASRIVSPKARLKDYFTATIGKSTMSERCTTCHQIDTPAKIADQHTGSVQTQDVFLAESIVNDDESINYCVNCHESGLPADFHETRWATPTPEQDINWGQIINANLDSWPREICNRLVGNLETADAREEHFHEDARLFWAVADGITPFGDELPTSHPKDYGLFLDRFDAWNAAGAPCPD